MSELTTAEEIASAATACWRAGCDERDGPKRIEAILTRLVSALTTRLAEAQASLEQSRKDARVRWEALQAAETRLAEVERERDAQKRIAKSGWNHADAVSAESFRNCEEYLARAESAEQLLSEMVKAFRHIDGYDHIIEPLLAKYDARTEAR